MSNMKYMSNINNIKPILVEDVFGIFRKNSIY